MSRGPGALQREILDAVARYGEPIVANRVCWEIAETRGALTGSGLQCRVERPFYTSFRAAVSRLRRTRLRMEARRIASADDLVHHYPYQTLFVWLRDLRRELLPIVRSHLQETAPIYAVGANERYLVEKLPRSRRAPLLKEWIRLERSIVPLFSTASDDGHYFLVTLIATGRHLFDGFSGIRSVRFSMRECLDQARQVFPGSVELDEVERFYARALPSSDVRRTEFKSRLYSCVEFGSTVKKTRLQDGLKAVLADARPGLFTPYEPRVVGPYFMDVPRDYKLANNGDLDALIMRDALRPLLFLMPN